MSTAAREVSSARLFRATAAAGVARPAAARRLLGVYDMRGEVVVDPWAPIGLGFDDMARQHRAVRIEVGELRAMIDSSRPTQRTDGYRRMLAVLVSRLRERLVLHFELEQEGAYVARVRAARPDTGEDLARFATDHEALLDAASRLATLLRAPSAPPDVVAKTMQWLDDLRQHEQAEDQFLTTVGEL